MKNYEKPAVVVDNEVAEGIYMASGDCYTASAWIHQTPETGRETYVIQANATHAAEDGHHSANQVLTISFNQSVQFVNCTSSDASLVSDGTSLSISYKYHANANEYHGLGEIEVKSGPGLAIVGTPTFTCDHTCAQGHTW